MTIKIHKNIFFQTNIHYETKSNFKQSNKNKSFAINTNE